MEDNKEEIKDEVKQPEEIVGDVNGVEPETPSVQPTEANGDTLTPSDVPELSSETEPTAEQVEEDLPGNGENGESVEEELERLLTQSQVNEIVGRTRTETREKALREIYDRYGVNDDEELNNIFGRGQAYDVLNENYVSQGDQLRQVMAENALLKSGISQSRWEDAKAILGAKGLDITQDNIISELQTHPEWLGNAQVNDMQEQSTKPLNPEMAEQFSQKRVEVPSREQPSVIRKVGSEVQSIPNDMSEDDQINKWFGLNK